MIPQWLEVHRGAAPLVVSIPHSGVELPGSLEQRFVSPWLARKDCDWWVDRLYAFAADLGATTVRTRICRCVIDVNRDPSGASLYPGQATTGLCPLTTFDGEPLYASLEPDDGEVARRRSIYFDPYHQALAAELAHSRTLHDNIVLFEAHAIRSLIPRLFDGELPNFNLGTNSGASCGPALTAAVEALCDASGFTRVTDGRFKGGWTTRRYGEPDRGVHAIQMELACRGYMDEPADSPTPETWPPPYSEARAAPVRAVLADILDACLTFAGA